MGGRGARPDVDVRSVQRPAANAGESARVNSPRFRAGDGAAQKNVQEGRRPKVINECHPCARAILLPMCPTKHSCLCRRRAILNPHLFRRGIRPVARSLSIGHAALKNRQLRRARGRSFNGLRAYQGPRGWPRGLHYISTKTKGVDDEEADDGDGIAGSVQPRNRLRRRTRGFLYDQGSELQQRLRDDRCLLGLQGELDGLGLHSSRRDLRRRWRLLPLRLVLLPRLGPRQVEALRVVPVVA